MNGVGLSRRAQNIRLNVPEPFVCKFQASKLFHLFRRTNKGVRKVNPIFLSYIIMNIPVFAGVAPHSPGDEPWNFYDPLTHWVES